MNITCYDSKNKIIKYLTQWDVNREVTIRGLDLLTAPMIHFFNNESKSALVVPSTLNEKDIVVSIPNILLQDSLCISACVYETQGENEGKTICTVYFPVQARKKPEDYTYTENIEYTNWVKLTEEAKAFLVILESQSAEMKTLMETVALQSEELKRIIEQNQAQLDAKADLTALNAVKENITVISAADGSFTAGNNYKLLDADGNIPAERLKNTTIPTDTTYKPDSPNPQSGTAVAEAVSSKVDKVNGKGLSSNDFTTELKTQIGTNKSKIEALEMKPDPTVDQTYSAVSEHAQSGKAVAEAIKDKVDKDGAKGLSTNDFTDADKTQIEVNKTDIQSLKDAPQIIVNDTFVPTSENPTSSRSLMPVFDSKMDVFGTVNKDSVILKKHTFTGSGYSLDINSSNSSNIYSNISIRDDNIVLSNKYNNLVATADISAELGLLLTKYRLENGINVEQSQLKISGVATPTEADDDFVAANKKFVVDAVSAIPVITVDSKYDSTSSNPQSGTAVAEAIVNKVDKISGKGLSSNDFTTDYINKINTTENNLSSLSTKVANDVINTFLISNSVKLDRYKDQFGVVDTARMTADHPEIQDVINGFRDSLRPGFICRDAEFLYIIKEVIYPELPSGNVSLKLTRIADGETINRAETACTTADSIVDNSTLIKDSSGSFAAGNNYMLLDAQGNIPTERLSNSVRSFDFPFRVDLMSFDHRGTVYMSDVIAGVGVTQGRDIENWLRICIPYMTRGDVVRNSFREDRDYIITSIYQEGGRVNISLSEPFTQHDGIKLALQMDEHALNIERKRKANRLLVLDNLNNENIEARLSRTEYLEKVELISNVTFEPYATHPDYVRSSTPVSITTNVVRFTYSVSAPDTPVTLYLDGDNWSGTVQPKKTFNLTNNRSFDLYPQDAPETYYMYIKAKDVPLLTLETGKVIYEKQNVIDFNSESIILKSKNMIKVPAESDIHNIKAQIQYDGEIEIFPQTVYPSTSYINYGTYTIEPDTEYFISGVNGVIDAVVFIRQFNDAGRVLKGMYLKKDTMFHTEFNAVSLEVRVMSKENYIRYPESVKLQLERGTFASDYQKHFDDIVIPTDKYGVATVSLPYEGCELVASNADSEINISYPTNLEKYIACTINDSYSDLVNDIQQVNALTEELA